jgi:hypothetical protein
VESGWHLDVRLILSTTGTIVGTNGEERALSAQEIDTICQELEGVVPIPLRTKFTDDALGGKKQYKMSFPLKLAKAVTIHRIQGTTMSKLLISLGKTERIGVTLTGFSRGTSPEGIVFCGPYSEDRLITAINKKATNSSKHFNIRLIEKKLDAMRNRTRRAEAANTLYE